MFFAMTILFAAGCRPAQSFATGYTARQLVGTWGDESGQETEISREDGRAVVTSIVDYDGEVFEIQESGVSEGLFHWQYLVPSTGYVVDIWVDSLDGDTAQTRWENPYAQGAAAITRVR